MSDSLDLEDAHPGIRIREFRHGLGLNGRAFAEALSISQAYLSAVERGKSRPSTTILEGLAKQFAVNVNWVLTGAGPVRASATTDSSGAVQPEELPDTLKMLEDAVSASPALVARAILEALAVEAPESREAKALAAVRAIFKEDDDGKLQALEAVLRGLAMESDSTKEQPSDQQPPTLDDEKRSA